MINSPLQPYSLIILTFFFTLSLSPPLLHLSHLPVKTGLPDSLLLLRGAAVVLLRRQPCRDGVDGEGLGVGADERWERNATPSVA